MSALAEEIWRNNTWNNIQIIRLHFAIRHCFCMFHVAVCCLSQGSKLSQHHVIRIRAPSPPFAVLTCIIFPSDLSSISPPLRRRSTGRLSHSLCHAVVMVHSPFLPWHAPVQKVIWSPLKASARAIKQQIINHICDPCLWSRELRHTEMKAQVSRLIRSDSLLSLSPAGHMMLCCERMQWCCEFLSSIQHRRWYFKEIICVQQMTTSSYHKWSVATDRCSCLILTCISDLSPVATSDGISLRFFERRAHCECEVLLNVLNVAVANKPHYYRVNFT